ncbi:hypothetical protein WI664_19130 [Vibrio cholerae]
MRRKRLKTTRRPTTADDGLSSAAFAAPTYSATIQLAPHLGTEATERYRHEAGPAHSDTRRQCGRPRSKSIVIGVEENRRHRRTGNPATGEIKPPGKRRGDTMPAGAFVAAAKRR